MESDLVNIVSTHLHEISYIAKNIDSKKESLLQKLENNVLDPKTIENVGLELISFLKKLKGNIFYMLDSLEIIIKHMNIDQNNCKFQQLVKEVTECKRNNIVKVENEFVFTESSDKSTNTDEHFDNVELCKINCNMSQANCNKISIKEFPSVEDIDEKITSPDNLYNDHPSIERLDLTLLKEIVTQDTDDGGWVNSIDKIWQPGMNNFANSRDNIFNLMLHGVSCSMIKFVYKKRNS